MVLIGSLVGCNAEEQMSGPATPPVRSAVVLSSSDAVPERGSETKLRSFTRMRAAELWTLGALQDSAFAIGLKSPGKARGVYRGSILLSDAQIVAGIAATRSMAGVEIMRIDSLLPPVSG